MNLKLLPKFPALLLFSGIALSSACSLAPPKNMMDVQIGETFELKQPITIAADSARQFIQFGKLTSRTHFSRFDQHCRLEVKKLSTEPQILHPEKFIIEKVEIGEEQVASNSMPMLAYADNGIQSDAQPNVIASLWHGRLASTETDSQPPETMDTVLLYLTPTAQNPNVFRLVCAGSLSDGSLRDAPRSYRPQRAEINQILGAFGQITP